MREPSFWRTPRIDSPSYLAYPISMCVLWNSIVFFCRSLVVNQAVLTSLLIGPMYRTRSELSTAAFVFASVKAPEYIPLKFSSDSLTVLFPIGVMNVGSPDFRTRMSTSSRTCNRLAETQEVFANYVHETWTHWHQPGISDSPLHAGDPEFSQQQQTQLRSYSQQRPTAMVHLEASYPGSGSPYQWEV